MQCVKEKVSQGDIKGAQEIGRKLADRNRVRQLRSEMLSPDQNTDHHSMEAGAITSRLLMADWATSVILM